MDRSEKVREFIRKLMDENFDFSNEKLRLEKFRNWCAEPEQTKEGFTGSKHRTLFTEQLKKVCREKNIDPTVYGLSRPKVSFVQSSGNVESNITPMPKKAAQTPSDHAAPPVPKGGTPPESQDKILIDEGLVRITWKTMFNLIRLKFKQWEALSDDELDALGKAWLPIFQKYLEKNWLFWGVPITVTFGVFMERIAKNQAKEKPDEEEVTESPKDSKDYEKWKKEHSK